MRRALPFIVTRLFRVRLHSVISQQHKRVSCLRDTSKQRFHTFNLRHGYGKLQLHQVMVPKDILFCDYHLHWDINYLFDSPRSCVVYNFDGVCLSVCS